MRYSRFFQKKLLKFYKIYGRSSLPWRKLRQDAYRVWVSEIMLQQTQVERVREYYQRFIERFPSVEDLARASWRQVFFYFRGLGYYRRAENMLRTAKIIVRRFSGKFPQDRSLLLKLPGIGEYTADAILSFAYGERVLSCDTNVRRVLGRFFFGRKDAVFSKEAFEKAFRAEMRTMNAALMDFASIICKNKPLCKICPLSARCAYFRSQGQHESTRNDRTGQTRFPAQSARVFLWLHRNQQEYYSEDPKQFRVFVLPPQYNTRRGIKEYFSRKYGLEVSVRPPHKKAFVNGIPTLFVRAQIQMGRHHFYIYSPSKAEQRFGK